MKTLFFKKVLIIVNPAAGKKEPAVSIINSALIDADFKYEIRETKKSEDAFNFTKEAVKKGYDLIAVYGGDGTVTEVARALYLKKTPLFIIPGGTANILAKELKIPEDTLTAVNLLKTKKFRIKSADMALMNNRPFILRINIGIFADMIKSANKSLKERFGQIAYSLTAFKHINEHPVYSFNLNIDGAKNTLDGVALMIANCGNIGVPGYSIVPNVHIADGYLDVVLFKSASPQSFLAWLKSLIGGKKPHGEIKHWRAKEVKVRCTPAAKIICDDISLSVKSVKAKVVSKAVNIASP